MRSLEASPALELTDQPPLAGVQVVPVPVWRVLGRWSLTSARLHALPGQGIQHKAVTWLCSALMDALQRGISWAQTTPVRRKEPWIVWLHKEQQSLSFQGL